MEKEMITIYLFGGLKEIASESQLTYSFEKPIPVSELFIKVFCDRPDIIKIYSNKIVYAVNQKQVSPNFCVNAKDTVAFMPPFAGG